MLRIIAALTVLGGQAVGQENLTLAYCVNVGDLAEVVMTHRQGGGRASEIIRAIEGMAEESGRSISQTETEIITLAYEETRWNGERMQSRAVEDFSVKIEAQCIAQLPN